MGISGLLPILKPIARLRHLREYRGKRVAVDAYSWLHKGAYTCSRELCEGVFTDKFVFYCMSRIQLMLSNGVVPVVVFDGCRMPSKNDEEEARRRSRRENRERALTHLQMGNLAAAEECFQRSVDVTPAMAKQFIEALKDKGVAFVVAPYEADAQMAYLALNGDVWAVVTEDSDLLAYGCPRVLYKLDKMGNGEEICLDDLPLNQGVSFMGFSHTMFLEMCIMAGCDFLPSLPGIGAKRAYAHMKKFRSFVKVCKSLRFGGTAVPRDYEERFQLALWVFRHQRVFCKDLQGCTHLRPLPPGGIGMADVDVPSAVPQPTLLPPPSNSPEDIDQFDAQQAALSDPLAFLGPWLPDSIARGLAAGDLDPSTLKPYDLAIVYAGASNMPLNVQQALGRMSFSKDLSSTLCRPKQQAAAARIAAVAPVTTLHALQQGPSSGHAVPRRHSLVSGSQEASWRHQAEGQRHRRHTLSIPERLSGRLNTPDRPSNCSTGPTSGSVSKVPLWARPAPSSTGPGSSVAPIPAAAQQQQSSAESPAQAGVPLLSGTASLLAQFGCNVGRASAPYKKPRAATQTPAASPSPAQLTAADLTSIRLAKKQRLTSPTSCAPVPAPVPDTAVTEDAKLCEQPKAAGKTVGDALVAGRSHNVFASFSRAQRPGRVAGLSKPRAPAQPLKLAVHTPSHALADITNTLASLPADEQTVPKRRRHSLCAARAVEVQALLDSVPADDQGMRHQPLLLGAEVASGRPSGGPPSGRRQPLSGLCAFGHQPGGMSSQVSGEFFSALQADQPQQPSASGSWQPKQLASQAAASTVAPVPAVDGLEQQEPSANCSPEDCTGPLGIIDTTAAPNVQEGSGEGGLQQLVVDMGGPRPCLPDSLPVLRTLPSSLALMGRPAGLPRRQSISVAPPIHDVQQQGSGWVSLDEGHSSGQPALLSSGPDSGDAGVCSSLGLSTSPPQPMRDEQQPTVCASTRSMAWQSSVGVHVIDLCGSEEQDLWQMPPKPGSAQQPQEISWALDDDQALQQRTPQHKHRQRHLATSHVLTPGVSNCPASPTAHHHTPHPPDAACHLDSQLVMQDVILATPQTPMSAHTAQTGQAHLTVVLPSGAAFVASCPPCETNQPSSFSSLAHVQQYAHLAEKLMEAADVQAAEEVELEQTQAAVADAAASQHNLARFAFGGPALSSAARRMAPCWQQKKSPGHGLGRQGSVPLLRPQFASKSCGKASLKQHALGRKSSGSVHANRDLLFVKPSDCT